jgi:excisionase family DNA binding protein
MLLGLSRSQLYELIRSGRLQTVTEGRVRLIPAAAIDAYVSLLTSEARADTWWRRGVIQAREACTGRSHGSAGSRLSISGTPRMGSAQPCGPRWQATERAVVAISARGAGIPRRDCRGALLSSRTIA